MASTTRCVKGICHVLIEMGRSGQRAPTYQPQHLTVESLRVHLGERDQDQLASRWLPILRQPSESTLNPSPSELFDQPNLTSLNI